MTPTKDQQAQEYVLNRQTARHNAKTEEEATMADFDKTRKVWDAYDMEQAFEDGYTAAEQSMWRSVEEELPSNDDNVLVYVPTTEFRIGGYEVAYYDGKDWYTSDGEHIRPSHFMYIPSLPDTNTEKK